MTHAFPGGLRQKDQLLAALESQRQCAAFSQLQPGRSPMALMSAELGGNPYSDSVWLAERIFGGVAEAPMLINYIFHNVSPEMAQAWPVAAIRHVEVGADLTTVPYDMALRCLQNPAFGVEQFLRLVPNGVELSRDVAALLSAAAKGRDWDQSLRDDVRQRVIDLRLVSGADQRRLREMQAIEVLLIAAEVSAKGMSEDGLEMLLDWSLRTYAVEDGYRAPEQVENYSREYIAALARDFLHALAAAPVGDPSPELAEFARASGDAA